MLKSSGLSIGPALYFAGVVTAGFYFVFAAVQGAYGVFERGEIEAEAAELRQELESLQADVARMENLTRRLSDEFLDLDLLDEQARDVLGMIRADELVVR